MMAANQFIGEIRAFAFGLVPAGWVSCDGQTLSTTTYAGLFAVLGHRFGGSNLQFAVPDLRGRVPVGAGTLQPGATVGHESVTVTPAMMAPHQHVLQRRGVKETSNKHNMPVSSGYVGALGIEVAGNAASDEVFAAGGADASLSSLTLGWVDGRGNQLPQGQVPAPPQPQENRQPFLVMQFCIAFEGETPTP